MSRNVGPAIGVVFAVAVLSCLTPPGYLSPPPATVSGQVSESPPSTPPSRPRPVPAPVPGLPSTFAWTSSAPLIVPAKVDAGHDLVAIKDPTVVRFNDRWHVYASSVARGGIYGMVYTSFADWNDAPKAPLYTMDKTRGFNTYVAAPQLFYFTPQKKWYLVFQSGPPMYATADDPG